MFIKQLSIFVENKSGRLAEIINLLGENNIDICALSIADTTNFGILRLIVNEYKRAADILSEHGITVKINNVIAIAVEDKPGGLAKALNLLYAGGVSIEYMYAFVGRNDNGAVVVIRADDKEKAASLLSSAKVDIIDGNEIYRLI